MFILKGDFEILIVSPYDREKLTCEIYFHNELLAEISQETEELLIEIYPTQKKCWEIPLEELQNILEEAKNHLIRK